MKNMKAFMILFFLSLLIIACLRGVQYLRDNKPNENRVDISSIFKVEGDQVGIIYEKVLMEHKALIVDGNFYVSVEFAKSYISDKVFFDSKELVLTFTTPTELVRSQVDTKEYTVNGQRKEASNKTIVVNEEDEVFISISFLELYCNYEHSFYEQPNRILIKELSKEDEIVSVKKETQIRVLPDIKSEIVADTITNQILYYLQQESSKDWTYVMTLDGYHGYINNKSLGEKGTQKRNDAIYEYENEYTNIGMGEPVSLVWHQVSKIEANSTIGDLISKTKGVNVVSPTWFKLLNAQGEIESIASKEYVNTIQQKGMQVWGLVTNQFDRNLTREMLQYTSRRDTFVKNMIALALEYGLDGINMDFESFNNTEGEAFTQLIRELSIECRKNKLVLSVDIYVPSAWNLFIDRTAISQVADYIIVMGYDEHWGGGPEVGSVSSIGFFEKGLYDTLEIAPANKIIMALPFYTRLWEKEGGEIVSYKAYGMDKARTILKDQGVEPVWDEVTGQFYAEYILGESVFQIWLEEEFSIEERMKVIKNADIAGVAAWKLGLESEQVWKVMESYKEK